MNDNEWAAEWLGAEYNQSLMKIPGGLWFRATDWQPDSNLNYFKMVLDKYRDWFRIHHRGRDPKTIKEHAWDDPSSCLELIRGAVEK